MQLEPNELLDVTKWGVNGHKVLVLCPRLVSVGVEVQQVANINQGGRRALSQGGLGALTVLVVGTTLFVFGWL